MTENAAAQNEWTIARLLAWTTQYLDRAQVDEPRLATELLLSHALGWAKLELYTRFDHVPGEDERTTFRELIRRAAQHEPVAYLIGRKEFYSLAFEVTPDVLIPRPETEALVERVIDYCRKSGEDEVHLLDLGTGSGCIAIAVLSQVPAARAVGSDISPGAVAMAQRNAVTHSVADRLTLVEADGLDLPPDCLPNGGFDLIVSNPPYVAQADMENLPENVRRYEPSAALSGGPDGLAFYRLLNRSAGSVLKPGGVLFVEIGAGAGPQVRSVLEAGGTFEHQGTWRDPADPHDRVMQFAFQGAR